LFRDYFDGSQQALLQFFAREEGLDQEEVERLLALLPDDDTGNPSAQQNWKPVPQRPDNPFRNPKNSRP